VKNSQLNIWHFLGDIQTGIYPNNSAQNDQELFENGMAESGSQ
jgi:hypothetical protein